VDHMEWLATPAGRYLLREESRKVHLALESLFGDQFLQVGAWGRNEFRKFARTKRIAVTSDRDLEGLDFMTHPDAMGVANDSIDILLLPHVLEVHPDPHAVLRELDRVLRADGHVIILGFNPVSLWGARHFFSRHRFPPGFRRMISEHRLRDWLRLLNFSIDHSSFHYFYVPLLGRRRGAKRNNLENGDSGRKTVSPRRRNRFARAVTSSMSAASQAWTQHAPFAGCYMVVARKAMFKMTPIRPAWKPQRRLVGGLVNPSTRNAA